MKKLAFVIGLIFLSALAIPAMAGGNGALVYKNGFCPIITGDYGTAVPGSNPPFGLLFADDSRFIMNGNVLNVICHGHLTENFPSEAVRYGNRTGGFPYEWLDAWQVVISPSGEVTLTGHRLVV